MFECQISRDDDKYMIHMICTFTATIAFLCCVINRLWGAFFQQNQFIRIFPYSHNFNLFQWSVQWYNNIILFKKNKHYRRKYNYDIMILFHLFFCIFCCCCSCSNFLSWMFWLCKHIKISSSFVFFFQKKKKKQSCNNLWKKNIHWKKKKKKKSNITRRRWNRTTEHISSPTDLKSALHTSEDHPRLKKLKTLLNKPCIYDKASVLKSR